MDDRINAYLEGELPFEALDAAEQAEARALEGAVRTAAGRFAGVRGPDLTARVMAALPAEPATATAPGDAARSRFRPGSLWPALADGLRSAFPAGGLAPRPALALAAFSLVVGIGLGMLAPAGPGSDPAAGPAVADSPASPQIFVRFELEAEGARDVRLAGSFTGWEPRYELTPLAHGRWGVTVPLEPGVHDYVFVVDGEDFMADPYAPRVSDGFGGFNSRLALLTPNG